MKSVKVSAALFALALSALVVSGCASNNSVSGRIFENSSQYFLRTDDGDLYQVTWYSGYQAQAGDEVILTNDKGACSMVSKNGSAQVFVKEN
jgi:outer membrane lipoprotein SlyB